MACRGRTAFYLADMNWLLQLGWALWRRVIGVLRLRTRGVKVMLFNGEGELLLIRNGYGDTAYSIARAPRYCGPDHPVTQMLHTLCYAGDHAPGDRCLPVYRNRQRGPQAPSPRAR